MLAPLSLSPDSARRRSDGSAARESSTKGLKGGSCLYTPCLTLYNLLLHAPTALPLTLFARSTVRNKKPVGASVFGLSLGCDQDLIKMLRSSRRSHRCIWAPVGRYWMLRQSGAEKLKGGSSRLRSRPAPGFE